MKKHTVRAFDAELDRIRAEIGRMGERVAAQLERAGRAFEDRRDELAEQVVAMDAEIDGLEHEVSQDALQLLALRQPMAADLRETLAAIRIAGNLERIGDLAKSLAKRSRVMNRFPRVPAGARLARMNDRVREQLQQVLGAYARGDADAAARVWRSDAELDDWQESLFRELLTYMMEDPKTITACTHLQFMAKNLERAGDHCTRIASAVHYLVAGKDLSDGRPKGADSRSAVVEPGDGRGEG